MILAPQQTLQLGTGGRLTTKLGFGCSSISGGLGKRTSLRLLETAYDAGIRHYDVAPMYGFGTAEEVLGEFARQHADITLATKYGIPPPTSGAALNALRTVVRPIANRLPALRHVLIRQAGQVAHTKVKGDFTAEAALRSLEASLRKLHVECLDLFLLHEAEARDLEDDRLLRMLEDAQRTGKVANFGIGNQWTAIENLIETHPEYCRVVQHDWSIFDDVPARHETFHVCYRTIAGAVQKLRAWFAANPETRDIWTPKLNANLNDEDTVARLLLHASFVRAPGVVLFSSRQKDRISRNAAACLDSGLSTSATLFVDLIHENLPKICEY